MLLQKLSGLSPCFLVFMHSTPCPASNARPAPHPTLPARCDPNSQMLALSPCPAACAGAALHTRRPAGCGPAVQPLPSLRPGGPPVRSFTPVLCYSDGCGFLISAVTVCVHRCTQTVQPAPPLRPNGPPVRCFAAAQHCYRVLVGNSCSRSSCAGASLVTQCAVQPCKSPAAH